MKVSEWLRGIRKRLLGTVMLKNEHTLTRRKYTWVYYNGEWHQHKGIYVVTPEGVRRVWRIRL